MAKAKKCKACQAEFTPSNSMQKACSIPCAIVVGRDDNARKEKRERQEKSRQEFKELRARKERLKTRRDHMREAQQAFNAFIRERDSDQPCISCGTMANDANLITGSRWDAGHYRSVGSCPELRFEELNCHRQCVRCNRDLSGNAVEFRIRLVKRIGLEKVEWLEGMHEPKRYTLAELEELKAKYRKLTRDLKKAA